MEIKVTVTNNYGREAVYPACAITDKFCAMLGQKTLTRQNIEFIRDMGFTVVVVNEQPQL
jgi:hypothetical protein